MSWRRLATSSPSSWAGHRANLRAHRFGKVSNDRGVERVSLREPPGGAGKVPYLARIDHRKRQPRRRQACRHHGFEASGRLQCDQFRLQRLQARRQGFNAFTVACDCEGLSVGRRCTSNRSLATSIPTNIGSHSRPCACGLAVRPRRPFGLIDPAEGAPRSCTGFEAKGRAGLPSATAVNVLRLCRGDFLIQGL